MYMAITYFHVKKGKELLFETLWHERESYLDSVQGFRNLFLLRGDGVDDYTPYISQFIWNSKNDFDAWTQSEAFVKAHTQFGDTSSLFTGKPEFAGYTMVLQEKPKKITES